MSRIIFKVIETIILYIILLDFIYRGSLFSIFTTLIYHKVLINNKTEQDTEQDKQTKTINSILELFPDAVRLNRWRRLSNKASKY